MVLARHGLSFFQNGLDSLQLLDSEGAVDFRETVVETQFAVLQPLARMGTSLVALCPGERGDPGALGDDNAAFTGSDLLVGVKREHPRVTQRPHLAPLVFSPNGFTCIFNHPQAMLPGDIENGRQVGRVPEGMYRQDGPAFEE